MKLEVASLPGESWGAGPASISPNAKRWAGFQAEVISEAEYDVARTRRSSSDDGAAPTRAGGGRDGRGDGNAVVARMSVDAPKLRGPPASAKKGRAIVRSAPRRACRTRL